MKNEKRAESREKNTSSKVFVKSHSSSLGYFRKRFRSFVTWQSSHHSLHTHYIRTLQFIFSFLPPSISHLAPSSVLPSPSFPPCCDFDALQITFPSPSVSLRARVTTTNKKTIKAAAEKKISFPEKHTQRRKLSGSFIFETFEKAKGKKQTVHGKLGSRARTKMEHLNTIKVRS